MELIPTRRGRIVLLVILAWLAHAIPFDVAQDRRGAMAQLLDRDARQQITE
jgi:hypothetical protein